MKSRLILLLFILFTACRKETPELPPITQTGANTFGLKLNGSVWVPKGFLGLYDPNLLNARLLGDVLIITAQNFSTSPAETEFELKIFGCRGPGTYNLNQNTTYPGGPHSYAYHVKRRITPLEEWITSAQKTGVVQISRLDTSARIVSGTFQFEAENLNDASKKISVTEGRFDVKY
ncbi:MAG: DUF6252 family protein [Chitinophagaceae bacterium]|nr:DUF6252 family protein [Chitinophagaceae bacterium]